MLPLQEITIKTKNGREFYVHLEKWSENHFDCKLAAIYFGPQSSMNASFGPFSKASTALDAFSSLIQMLTQSLSLLDNTDSISVIDNPCNTEFIDKIAQTNICGSSISILVNGK
ncbi:hypothetical protein [Pectobacterium carotovorum]|uniref:hypothetical protein n=1 Tax=Pectobacterium carotovorum TaxID=554 RepID=UPI003017A36D